MGKQFLNLFVPMGTQHCNVVLWFLPCLFLANVMVCYLRRWIHSKIKLSLFLLGCICTVGLLHNGYPYYISQAVQALPYVLIGFILGGNVLKPNDLCTSVGRFNILIGCISLFLIYISGVTCNMQSCSYTPCYPFSFIIGLLGFLSIYLLSYSIQKSKILSWLGLNSLAIMLLHEPVKRIVIKISSAVFSIPIELLRESIFASLTMTALTISILIPVILIINKYMPFLLGKFSFKNKI